jgi:hypothetical protein
MRVWTLCDNDDDDDGGGGGGGTMVPAAATVVCKYAKRLVNAQTTLAEVCNPGDTPTRERIMSDILTRWPTLVDAAVNHGSTHVTSAPAHTVRALLGEAPTASWMVLSPNPTDPRFGDLLHAKQPNGHARVRSDSSRDEDPVGLMCVDDATRHMLLFENVVRGGCAVATVPISHAILRMALDAYAEVHIVSHPRACVVSADAVYMVLINRGGCRTTTATATAVGALHEIESTRATNMSTLADVTHYLDAIGLRTRAECQEHFMQHVKKV